MLTKGVGAAFVVLVFAVAVSGCRGNAPLQKPPDASDESGSGLLLTSPAQYRSYPSVARRYGAGGSGSAPKSFTLPGLPPVADQGTQWSCVGFAVAYARTYAEHLRFSWKLPYTDDHRLSPAFIYNQGWEKRSNANCLRAGMEIGTAMNLIVQAGVASLKSFQYNPATCDVAPGAAALEEASMFQALGWRTVPIDESVIKDYVLLKAPIVIGVGIPGDLRKWTGSENYKGLNGRPSQENHAMVVVGYDDNRHAFRVVNSWGTTWGDGGLAWMDYALFKPGSLDVFEAYVTYAKPSETDLAGSTLYALANYAVTPGSPAGNTIISTTLQRASPGDVVMVDTAPGQLFKLFGLKTPSTLVEPASKPADLDAVLRASTTPSKIERTAMAEHLTFIVPKGGG